MDIFEVLANEICLSPYLKLEDQAVIRTVCEQMRVTESPGDINDHYRKQIEAEAACVYLVGRYRNLLSKLRFKLDQHKAGRYVELGDKTDEGYKWSAKGKEQWLLGTDAKYLVQFERLIDFENTVTMIKHLSDMVFKRDDKLEQLSINYRRETEIDKRHG